MTMRALFNKLSINATNFLHYKSSTGEHAGLERNSSGFSQTEQETTNHVMQNLGFARDQSPPPPMNGLGWNPSCFEPPIDLFFGNSEEAVETIAKEFLKSECKPADYSTYLYYATGAALLACVGYCVYRAFTECRRGRVSMNAQESQRPLTDQSDDSSVPQSDDRSVLVRRFSG